VTKTKALPETNQPSADAAPDLPAAPEVDEHAGKGGMYEIVDGKRRLMNRTEHPEPAPAKAD
jgi:hypothetical protein